MIAAPDAPDIPRFDHWIDGSAHAAKGQIVRVSPETGKPAVSYAEGTADDAAAAVASARIAFDDGAWPRLSGTQRAEVLLRWAALVDENAERLAQLEVTEAGKTIRLARDDIGGVAGLIRYAAALAQQNSGEAFMDFGGALNAFVVHEPVGVVGAIVPWNFPSIIFAQKVPFALAAGCTVVVKPSEMTSGTAVVLAELAGRAGLPDGALNVVTGYGDPVGQYLVESPDVDMISFTGSTRTGRKVLEGPLVNFKRVALELGGKSAAIVFGDADIEAAVEGVMFSIFMHQGQVCCAGSRLLVEDSFADTFLSALVGRARQLVVGDLRDERTDIGPLISRQHFAVVSNFVEQAGEEGAEVLCGGGPAAGGSLVFLPTVLDRVGPSMTVFNEEIFGPVLTVTRFRTPDEAVALANQSQYGLAGSVWTSSIDVAFDVAKRVRTGTIEINTSLEGQPQLPFGGYKASGMGREKGTTGLAEFTETKTIGLRIARRPSFFSAPA